MYKHGWIKALILAGLLMLPSASAMAAVVEMIIVPCLPGMRPEECGLKVSVTGGTATLTTAAGDVIDVAPGTAVTVSGTGIVSEAPQTGTMLDFASAGSSSQTATGSTGEAGAAGGAGGAPLPSGGSGSSGGTPAGGGTGSGSGGSFGGGGSVGGGSGSGSIGGGSLTGGGGTTVVSGGGATTPMTPAPQ